MIDSHCAQDGSRHDMPGEGYLRKNEVAARLRQTTKTIERWMAKGIIPYIKLGVGRRATVLFRWADIQTHLDARFRVGGAR